METGTPPTANTWVTPFLSAHTGYAEKADQRDRWTGTGGL